MPPEVMINFQNSYIGYTDGSPLVRLKGELRVSTKTLSLLKKILTVAGNASNFLFCTLQVHFSDTFNLSTDSGRERNYLNFGKMSLIVHETEQMLTISEEFLYFQSHIKLRKRTGPRPIDPKTVALIRENQLTLNPK